MRGFTFAKNGTSQPSERKLRYKWEFRLIVSQCSRHRVPQTTISARILCPRFFENIRKIENDYLLIWIHYGPERNYFHVQCVKQTNEESHRSTRTEWNVCRRGKLSAQFWHEIIIKALLVGKFPSGQFGDSGLKEAARGTTRKEKEELRRISVRRGRRIRLLSDKSGIYEKLMPVDHQIIGARLREIGDEVNQSGQRNRSSTSEQILFLMLFLILLRTPCPIQHKRKDWSGLRKNILFQV